jgi:hypothetical protein
MGMGVGLPSNRKCLALDCTDSNIFLFLLAKVLIVNALNANAPF